MLRSEVETKYTWDLSKFYKDDKSWQADFKKLKKFVGVFASYKQKLGNADVLFEYLQKSKQCDLLLTRLYMYASNNFNTCLSNSAYGEMTTQLENLATIIGQEDSFVEPELLSYSEEYLTSLQKDKRFKNYKFYFKDLLRDKKHVLSEKEEALLSAVGSFAGDTSDVFNSLADVDFKFDDALDSKGEAHKISSYSDYVVLIKNKDRVLRQNAYKSYYKQFENFNNTISLNYITNLKADLFYAKARKFNNTFEAALYGDNIPKQLYKKLKEQVRLALPITKKYYELRKKALGVEELTFYDVNVSICNDIDKKFTFEEAKTIVLEALKPLGDEYVNVVKQAFNDRWIDVYPTKDKKSGGYETNSYDETPIILLNFVGDISDVFTLAHELGHAMHSYLTCKAQPYETHDYTIFLAEIASTFNEVLLTHYFLNNAKTNQEKLYFLDRYINLFNGTIFRQMQYSEFEEQAHNLVANNAPISKEILNKCYYDLNATYNPGVKNDDIKKYHWSCVPHFYRSFYVYKYATGLISAVSLALKVLQGNNCDLKNYFKFLSAGASDYSINILKNAGVDLTSNCPYELAFAELKKAVDQLEKLI